MARERIRNSRVLDLIEGRLLALRKQIRRRSQCEQREREPGKARDRGMLQRSNLGPGRSQRLTKSWIKAVKRRAEVKARPIRPLLGARRARTPLDQKRPAN